MYAPARPEGRRQTDANKCYTMICYSIVLHSNIIHYTILYEAVT